MAMRPTLPTTSTVPRTGGHTAVADRLAEAGHSGPVGSSTGENRVDAVLLDRFRAVRSHTEALAAPLSAEDQTVQSMPDVSPTKWHRAHTTWFFETFVLGPFVEGYRPYDPAFAYLFNSYYEAAGPRHARPERGLITRPGVGEVAAYRDVVDEAVAAAFERGVVVGDVASLVELGLHHEQQHQELLLMDIQHVLSRNPMLPAYRPATRPAAAVPARSQVAAGWFDYDGGTVEIGTSAGVEGGAESGAFCFDNEGPLHQALIHPFRLSTRLVTNGEWQEFIADGGYERSDLWLSDGWATIREREWTAPLYWLDGGEQRFSLDGVVAIDPSAPVCHISHYEADAFARWAGARLPTEFEWEAAVNATGAVVGRTHSALQPVPVDEAAQQPATVAQVGTDVWEWTASAYLPYPRFEAAAGAVGEYNGKFMSNQMVLRGGSCLTPAGHTRATYRNFFPPAARWVMAGLRLAVDA